MNWYEDEVKRVENEKNRVGYKPKTIFYGSSSITLWSTLYQDFEKYYPLNLGFGGSTLEACTKFFSRIMKPYKPDHIVVYAGDNDLGDGKKPEEVFALFRQLTLCIKEMFDNISFTYISIKPSIARWGINQSIHYTNELIKREIDRSNGRTYFVNIYDKMLDDDGLPVQKFYEPDGLHLSSEGYLLWKEILLTHFSSINDSGLT